MEAKTNFPSPAQRHDQAGAQKAKANSLQ